LDYTIFKTIDAYMYIVHTLYRGLLKKSKNKNDSKVINGNKKYNDFAYYLNIRLLKTKFYLLDIYVV
jgi:hypothetical protein